MATFIQLVFAGIALGCIYALIGLGFSIIFKATDVINFAQGEFLLVGAYIIATAMNDWQLNFLVAILLAIVLTTLISLVFERFILRRLIGRPTLAILMITIGLDIVLRTGVIVIKGSDDIASGNPYGPDPRVGFDIGDVHFGANDLWTIFITLLLCGLLYYFLRFTKYGLAMRAAALDQEAALALGINVRTTTALAWGISAAIATLGGFFLAAGAPLINPLFGSTALLAFPAIILGGIDSVSGAIVGGLFIGLAQELTAGYESHVASFVGVGIHEITPYIIMILVLLIRPYGLFGSRKVERI